MGDKGDPTLADKNVDNGFVLDDGIDGLELENAVDFKFITLKSKNEETTVSEKVLERIWFTKAPEAKDDEVYTTSKLVSNILEGDQKAPWIVVKQVDVPTLKIIVKYLKRHKGIPATAIKKPLRSFKVQGKDSFIINEDKNIQQFDRDLLEELLKNKRTLFNVILVANYMDVQGLLHLGCAGVASMIKGKSPEEIKRILGEADDEGLDKDVSDPSGDVKVTTASKVLKLTKNHIDEDIDENVV